MALWSVKLADETRAGLTIYQLQELIRSGQVTADSEVSAGALWLRVSQVPALVRALPEKPAGVAPTVVVHGIVLELGPDGTPLPPSPAVVAQLLAGASPRKPRHNDSAASFNRWALAGVSVAVVALLLFVLRQVSAAHGMLH
jgi:hypothetical protein